VITNDTGMLHMTQAVGIPVVAVFGPTTKELGFFPLPTKSKIAEADIKCRPCTQKGLNSCPKTHFNCMKHVNPENVISLAQELLHSEKTKQ
jgi:heptosyltransferase-2